MIVTKTGVISSVNLAMTLQKLASSPLHPQAAYRVKKMVDAVNKAKKQVSENYRETLAKPFGVYDEKGDVVPESNEYGFKLKEGVDVVELQKKFEAFNDIQVEIDREPLSISDFGDSPISASEIHALEPILFQESSVSVPKVDNVVSLKA